MHIYRWLPVFHQTSKKGPQQDWQTVQGETQELYNAQKGPASM